MCETNARHSAAARALLDRAATALAVGLVNGSFELHLAAQDGALHPPGRVYTGQGWEEVAQDLTAEDLPPAARDGYQRALFGLYQLLDVLGRPGAYGAGFVRLTSAAGGALHAEAGVEQPIRLPPLTRDGPVEQPAT